MGPGIHTRSFFNRPYSQMPTLLLRRCVTWVLQRKWFTQHVHCSSVVIVFRRNRIKHRTRITMRRASTKLKPYFFFIFRGEKQIIRDRIACCLNNVYVYNQPINKSTFFSYAFVHGSQCTQHQGQSRRVVCTHTYQPTLCAVLL